MDNSQNAIEALLDTLKVDEAVKENTRQDLVRAIAANATRRVFETLPEDRRKEYLAAMGDPQTMAKFFEKHVPAAVVSGAIEEATAAVLEKFIAEIEGALPPRIPNAANDPAGE